MTPERGSADPWYRPHLAAVRPAPASSAPPVLVGERQGVGVVMTGSLGLLVLSLLLSVFLPSVPQPGNGIRSSNHSFSSQAQGGQGHLSIAGLRDLPYPVDSQRGSRRRPRSRQP